MSSLYFYCAAGAGTVLALQLLGGLLGIGHDADIHDGSVDLHLDHADATAGHDMDHADSDQEGARFLGILSLRAIASAVMMFGLAGLSAQRMYSPRTAFLVAAACGVMVLFGVAALLQGLYNFANDGTVHDYDTIGATGSVYLSIPGHRKGKGKVTIVVQDRTMEYEALTSGESLPTGTQVLVVDVPALNVLEVVRAEEPSPSKGTKNA